MLSHVPLLGRFLHIKTHFISQIKSQILLTLLFFWSSSPVEKWIVCNFSVQKHIKISTCADIKMATRLNIKRKGGQYTSQNVPLESLPFLNELAWKKLDQGNDENMVSSMEEAETAKFNNN